MLNLTLDSFMIELKDGSIKNVGPTNKSATAKLYDVETAEARAFGDRRLKIVAEDAAGDEVQIALSPDDAEAIVEDVESLRDESGIFE
jgi:hypothetical protein